MDLARGTGSCAMHQTQNRADAGRIARRSFEPHAQARPGMVIVIELGFGAVLRHDEVNPAVAVVVAERGAAALTVNAHAAFLRGHGFEPAAAIAPEPHAEAG